MCVSSLFQGKNQSWFPVKTLSQRLRGLNTKSTAKMEAYHCLVTDKATEHNRLFFGETNGAIGMME